MGNYVNQVLFTRGISDEETHVPFTVEMTDFLDTSSLVVVSARRFQYDPKSPETIAVTGLTSGTEFVTPIEVTVAENHRRETGASVTIASTGAHTGSEGTWTITKTGERTFMLDSAVCGDASGFNGIGAATFTTLGSVDISANVAVGVSGGYRAVNISGIFLGSETPAAGTYRVQIVVRDDDSVYYQEANIIVPVT